ncbi:hypothetical protein [Flavobacterium cerinum]|uniref:HEAT repeat domain-containing protein n=1 Tax=Flavobacterium cerinum TaxID=2502784 RepID=A0ABY5IQ57_9FLAO|nr:hypothetical protein [Flavobacterium cerinum]UUC44920.1 hypothetical protein NOX80_14975 [Flavobacterium cerinum]
MINIQELYMSDTWKEPFLIGATILFVTASFLLYLLIIKSRNSNIKKEKRSIAYSTIIDKLLFTITFEEVPIPAVLQQEEYTKQAADRFFREEMIESILNLHKNYDGLYAQKLEQFYTESGLIQDSFKKLKSRKWDVQCKGITELAEMNVNDAFDRILICSKARNKTLQITAINACIKLEGIKGIVHLAEHPYPIDDWTTVNIIAAFKKHDIGDTQGAELLLESRNTTVVTLGLKLIRELKLTQKVPYVAQLAEKTPNTTLKYEAQNVLQTLTV